MSVKNQAPILGPLLRMFYLRPTVVKYRLDDDFLSVIAERGVGQGDPLSMDLFTAVLSKALAPIDAGLGVAGVSLPRFADNMTTVGPPIAAFAVAEQIAAALVPTGMKLKARKCKVLLPDTIDAATSVATMNKATQLGFTVASGITLCGSPIGPPAYCKGVEAATVKAACVKMGLLAKLARFDPTSGGLSKQNALVLMRYCVAPACIVNLLRSTPPDLVKEAAATFDEVVEDTLLAITESTSLVSSNDVRARFNQRLHLDAVGGGGGFASAVALAEPAFLGSMALTAHHAAKFLPPGTNLRIAFADTKKLIDNGALRDVVGLKDVTLADMANDA